MNTKSRRNGDVWSAAAMTLLWLRAERGLKAIADLKKAEEEIVRLLREVTA